jgi:hypothetical protein
MTEMAVTSLLNWEKFWETGDNAFLGDIDIMSAPEGTEAVLSAEGLERQDSFALNVTCNGSCVHVPSRRSRQG